MLVSELLACMLSFEFLEWAERVSYLDGQCVEMVQHNVVELWQCCVVLNNNHTCMQLYSPEIHSRFNVASVRDAWIPFCNIRILSVSVKNYPYPYPIRSDVVNCYPRPWFCYGTITSRVKKFSFKLCRWRFLTHSVCILASFWIPAIFFPNFTSTRNSADDLLWLQLTASCTILWWKPSER